MSTNMLDEKQFPLMSERVSNPCKLNLTTTWEDVRRLGIILTAAGLLSGVLEDGNVVTAGDLALAGLVLLLFGNLEYS